MMGAGFEAQLRVVDVVDGWCVVVCFVWRFCAFFNGSLVNGFLVLVVEIDIFWNAGGVGYWVQAFLSQTDF